MKCYCLPGQCFQNSTGHSQDPQDNAKLTKFLDSFKLFCLQFSCTCFHVSAKLDVKESKFDISHYFTKPMYVFVQFVPKFLVQFIISVQTSQKKTYQKKNTLKFTTNALFLALSTSDLPSLANKKPIQINQVFSDFFGSSAANQHPAAPHLPCHRRGVPSQKTWEKNIRWLLKHPNKCVSKEPSKCVSAKKITETSRYTAYSSSY